MKNLNKIWIIFGILVTGILPAQSQNKGEPVEGIVSFVTSQNVYVKIINASTVEVGDTLFIGKSGTSVPGLVVTAKSSISLVTEKLPGVTIEKGQSVQYFPKVGIDSKELKEVQPKEELITETPKKEQRVSLREQERINGRLSAASYSTFGSNNSSATHRIMERAQLDIEHIQGSAFSFESYLNINQIYQERMKTALPGSNRVRVYNLALTYDNPDKFKATIGRQINRNMSSIGAVDGLQFEKSIGKISFGAIAGFKPDLYDYGFNTMQGQFGAYSAFTFGDKKTIQTSSTIGIIDQRNAGNVDRRYAYLQHQSTVLRELNLFVSSELDLFDGNIDSLKTGARLTNLFVSARYRFSNSLSLMVSYDQRKRVIYYESYQLDIEDLLNNDYITTGWRSRVNYKISKKIYLGLNYNSRNRDNSNFSSMGGNITINKLPFVSGSFSLYYNRNDGRSVSSESFSASYRNRFLDKKLSTYTYYRYVGYTSIGFEGTLTTQHYFGSKVDYRLNNKLSMGVLGEYSFNDFDQNYRVNLQIIKRFGK